MLEVESISCAYRDSVVVRDLSFAIGVGEIACLLGPSGCGKTTVLRALAGFSRLHGGSIRVRGETISSVGFTRAPEHRQMGMVFQDYALFPHLTVAENIAFGLKDADRPQKARAVGKMLELVRLPDLSKRYPHELSGGQQQRVALARALAPKPQLLLMDEPFSNLDTELRKQLSGEVRDILKQQGIAAIVVTHDQEEAFTISDRLGVLAGGVLQQWGRAESLYYEPANPLVAGFVGKGSLFEGVCLNETCVETELGLLEFAEPFCAPSGRAVKLFIRPSDLHPGKDGSVEAEVLTREFLGGQTLYGLRLPNGRQVESEVREKVGFQPGDRVRLQVAVHRPIAFFD
ncbi:ABC transporter ATP-binding protein [Marinobacterium nitratireducens]|uniref:ABC transporter ATP-binding protein n=1 Tax=Marinobacterium nitratireducens TaxID=518897 RepID=A0A918DUE9_9GAMM|nr:ABC transporter ATP-binding protein [Marinobacterium nitratireducens]